MKHLLLTTALIAAGATAPALADTSVSGSASTTMNTPATDTYLSQRAEGHIRASDFIGMRVYAAADSGELTDIDGADDNWENIGEINDVIINRSGEIEAVLVDIGGFLGIGERQVAVTLNDVQFVSDSSTEDAEDFFLVLNADPDTLQDAPEFRTEVHATVDERTMGEKAGDAMDTAAARVGESAEAAGDSIANATDTMGEKLNDAGESMKQAASDATEEVKEGAADLTRSAEATGEKVEEEANEMADASSDAVTPETDRAMNGTPVGDDYMTAENLEGARVFDANDEWVGEISELIIAGDGQITEAIVDVGGFLGIGEKPVALKLSDLQILRQDDGEEVRIYTAMAEEELKAMPRFEK